MRRRALFALVAILAVGAFVLAPSPGSARDTFPRSTETAIGDEPAFDTTGRRPASAVYHPDAMGDDDGWTGGQRACVNNGDGQAPVCVSTESDADKLLQDVGRQVLRTLIFLHWVY